MVARAMNTGILGVVLAGGRSRRFGTDKALAILAGASLLERACERAAPQVDRLLINRNSAVGENLSACYAVLPDEDHSQGPLAGVIAALRHGASHGYGQVAIFPCDVPFFPLDTVQRLAADAPSGDLRIVRRGGEAQYVFGLWSTEALPALVEAFGRGVRSIRAAATAVSATMVDFPLAGDGPDGNAFFNINGADDFAQAERWLERRRASGLPAGEAVHPGLPSTRGLISMGV